MSNNNCVSTSLTLLTDSTCLNFCPSFFQLSTALRFNQTFPFLYSSTILKWRLNSCPWLKIGAFVLSFGRGLMILNTWQKENCLANLKGNNAMNLSIWKALKKFKKKRFLKTSGKNTYLLVHNVWWYTLNFCVHILVLRLLWRRSLSQVLHFEGQDWQ